MQINKILGSLTGIMNMLGSMTGIVASPVAGVALQNYVRLRRNKY